MATDKKPTAKPSKTRKVKMTSYMSGKDFSYSPGDIAELDTAEADRVVSVGGAIDHAEEAGEQEKA